MQKDSLARKKLIKLSHSYVTRGQFSVFRSIKYINYVYLTVISFVSELDHANNLTHEVHNQRRT